MRLRLLRRAQPDPPREGRHARLVAGPTVPGAAATLVASAMSSEHLSPPPTMVNAPAVVPLATALMPRTDVLAYPEPVMAGVSLGFADGAQVDLAPDDPRARPFRAAAAALLEQPRH